MDRFFNLSPRLCMRTLFFDCFVEKLDNIKAQNAQKLELRTTVQSLEKIKRKKERGLGRGENFNRSGVY